MTVKVRERKGRPGFQVDIQLRLPDGTKHRERLQAPVSTKSAALRWGQQREGEIIAKGGDTQRVPVRPPAPTLVDFWDRFKEGHVDANGLKPSYKSTIDTLYKCHLAPAFGATKLDAIGSEAVQRFKGKLLKTLSQKSANNVLTLLSNVLRHAEEWDVIERAPRVGLYRPAPSDAAFYDFEEYARLVQAAHALDDRYGLMVLLGGDAGLRRGEMVALEWQDVDIARGVLTIQRSEWDGHVTAPKGGRARKVPMTNALVEALKARPRPIDGGRILTHDDKTAVSRKTLHKWMGATIRRARLGETNGLHVLRHTFCSHLAMRGAPAKAIQELAGHADLSTTMRYMHLSPAARESAIRLLDSRSPLGGVSPSVAPNDKTA